jgi:soluble lytic murein transglycosylase-like protein
MFALVLLGDVPARAEPAETGPMERWRELIAEAAERFGVDGRWISAVMRAESGGLTELNGLPITSSAGAMGLMQVMPKTYESLRLRYGLGGNPHDPHDNVMAGAAYLRELYDRYGYPGLFAAYNAGPARLDAQLREGRPLPAETTAYLAAVGHDDVHDSDLRTNASGTRLFFASGNASLSPSGPLSRTSGPNDLFIRLRGQS